MVPEKSIVRALRAGMGLDGPPEDAESAGGIVMATDALAGSSDVPPRMRLRDVSRKAVAAVVSDFAAKGAVPLAGTVSVLLPPELWNARSARQLAGGVREACAEFGFPVVGGDTGRGAELSVTVTLAGRAGRAVPRSGARPGDLLCSTGPFGSAAAGLLLVSGGRGSGSARFDSECRKKFCRPSPSVALGRALARYASASMDCSDGLAATLHEMARGAGARFVLEGPPHDPMLERAASANGTTAADLALFGGEDYEAVLALPPQSARRAARSAGRLGAGLLVLGRVERGSGVYWGGLRVPDGGWEHGAGARPARPRPRRAGQDSTTTAPRALGQSPRSLGSRRRTRRS